MKPKRTRPRLRLELPLLGTVDPFSLFLEESPPGSGRYAVGHGKGARVAVERAGICLVGAGEALMNQAMSWMIESGKPAAPGDLAPPGQVRLALVRREGRLLANLLRRHVRRLPQPPDWMGELLRSLEELDDYLCWQEASDR